MIMGLVAFIKRELGQEVAAMAGILVGLTARWFLRKLPIGTWRMTVVLGNVGFATGK